MKITNVEGFPVWGGHRTYMFIVVETDEGIYGVGETGIGGREKAILGAIEHFKPLLIGQNPFRTEHLWQTLARGGFFPAQRILMTTISAIDIALWDIKGKALNRPVYDLLGGRVRDKVVCYPHNVGHGMAVEPLVELCLKTKEEGWKFVRWGMPNSGGLFEPRQAIAAALKQFEAVRQAIGHDIEICFDVHTRLDLPDALRFCTEVERFEPFFIEDALRSENPQTYRSLRQRTRVPLAIGEQYSSKWEFRQVVEEELLDYARIDLCIVGGFTEALKVAGWCETHYIKIATHNPLGPISSAACLHFNLAVSNFGVQEQPTRPGTQMTDVVPVQMDWQDGYLLPPTRPGLGVEFDRDEARKHPFRQFERTYLHRADGTFTNW